MQNFSKMDLVKTFKQMLHKRFNMDKWKSDRRIWQEPGEIMFIEGKNKIKSTPFAIMRRSWNFESPQTIF